MMRRRRAAVAAAMIVALAACGGAPEPQQPAGIDTLTARCSFCHGPEGISGNAIWPSIAGLDAAYAARQLDRFAGGRGGGRDSPSSSQMHAIAADFDEGERRRIAAHYAGLAPPPWSPVVGHPGASLYGAGEGDVPACATCHGALAQGNAATGAPRLAGQPARYAAGQLRAYADGTRDDAGSGMAAVAKAMNDDQIRSVADYLEASSTGNSR